MKKRALMRAILLLLSLILLASCQNTSTNEGQTTGAETTQAPNASEDSLLLAADQKAYCGIVRARDANTDVKSLCAKLSTAIEKRTNSTVQTIADTRQLSEGMIEILIGDTNRPESAEAKKKLGQYQYSVSVINGKIVAAGSDVVMLEKAIEHLINMLEIPSEQLNRGVWMISNTYSKRFDGSDYSYNDYIGKGFELTAQHTLLPKLSVSGGTTSTGERIPWAQGGCTDGTYYYYCMITDNSVSPTKCQILKFDIEKQTLVKVSKDLMMGHANDATYNPHTNTVIVSEAGTAYHLIDPDTLTIKETVHMSPCWAISYNPDLRIYVLADNSKFYIYDENYRFQKEFSIEGIMGAEFSENGNFGSQGLTTDDKFIYYLEYWQNKNNHSDIRCNIVVFDIRTGKFLERIPLKMGREVENIDIYNDTFYIVCNNIFWTGSECYKVKIVPKV
ncbi:MAG: hypothetical protein J6B71_05105 [Clostridia bacterium]|nr:hypothetical protein [Clostridia bacterium]